MINPIERITQNRIVKLFTEQLNYAYYGNWEERLNNSNVEQDYLRAFLQKQGYAEALVNKAVSEVAQLANSHSGNLYERNKKIYNLLRYGVKARPELGEQFDTVFPIDWQNWEKNDFAIAEGVTCPTF
jgi:type I restriction enzyme R subunit